MLVQGFIIGLLINCVSTENERILGCNGVIKSPIPIDYSNVHVKLISKEGNLKDTIECAPNNGYFFLPIYDKGQYTLQASSYSKWSFEPNEVKIDFNGVDDKCSRGEDIVFKFTGFRVFGKVDGFGEQTGPKGVTVTLIADLPTEQKEIASVVTGKGGIFDISNVLPGSYILKASHPRWKISKSLITLKVTDANFEVPSYSLIFVGYDVTGSVTSNGEPISGVHFVLFSSTSSEETIDPNFIPGCKTDILGDFEISDPQLKNAKHLCHVTSTKEGLFQFPALPKGSYTVVPFYRGDNLLKFDMHPKVTRFTIDQDSHVFTKPFIVSGFTLVGRVLSQEKNGKPLQKLTVIIDKEKTVLTNLDGAFIFEGIKTGRHNIQVKGDGYKFDSVDAKVSPNSAVVPTIYPSLYEVCGYVDSRQTDQVNVKFTNSKNEVKIVLVGNDGRYCTFLPPDKYSVKVVATDHDPNNSNWYLPDNFPLTIVDQPIKNIDFKQEMAQLYGEIVCTDLAPDDINFDKNCKDVNIQLKSIGSISKSIVQTTRDGVYNFPNLTPGQYELSISDAGKWCWDSSKHVVAITQVQNGAPVFKRMGISLTVYSTHDTALHYEKLNPSTNKLKKEVLEVKTGSHRYCYSGSSVCEFTPVGCHRFVEEKVKWQIGQGSVYLNAISHEVTGTIISADVINDLKITIRSLLDEKKLIILDHIKAVQTGKEYVYKIKFQVGKNDKVAVTPESSFVLFTPASLTITGKDDCAELDEPIFAKRGIRLEGSIDPSLPGVNISIMNELDKVVVSMLTDQSGKYKFAPLHSGHDYRVVAEKEGYTFSEPLKNGTIIAHKLAEIKVELVDDIGKPLQGVLLSLSGGENYRRTSQSNNEGSISFLSLKAGEYYLRPVLKEYKFKPPSTVIHIEAGKTISVVFRGQRVLFSAFGTVLSLNKSPEENIVVEAIGKEATECAAHQEEASTNNDGQFRIRGLLPGCEYNIKIKIPSSQSDTEIVQKSIPSSVNLKMSNEDADNVELITIPEFNQCDVSVLIEFTKPEYFRTLQLKLMDENGITTNTVKLNEWKVSKYPMHSILLPLPTLPLNKRKYTIQLDSTLSKSKYSYESQSVHFNVDRPFRTFTMNFNPELRISDGDIKYSYSSVIFMALMAILYYCRESAFVIVLNALNTTGTVLPQFINKFAQSTKRNGGEITTTAEKSQKPLSSMSSLSYVDYEEPTLTVVKRKVKHRRV